MDRWRGRLHLARFLAKWHWKLLLASALLLLSAIVLWLSGVSGPGGVLGLVVVIAGAVLLRANMRHSREEWHQWYGQPYSPLLLKDCRTSSLYDSFQMLEVGDDLVLYSPMVNERLMHSTSPLLVRYGTFTVPLPASRYQEFALRYFGRGRIQFDAPKLRLVTDVTPETLDAGDPVTVQQTTYFASVATNELAGVNIKSRPESSTIFDGRTLVIRPGGLLADLRDSDCSNHVGVSTLAFTSDGNIPIMPQSQASAQSPGLDAPSGSGSLDYIEIAKARTLQDLVCAGMVAELFEEALGGGPVEGVETLLLGYVRLLGRGGKPEFFGVSRLDHPRTALFVRRKERQYHHGIDQVKVDMRSPRALTEDLRRVRQGDRALSTHLYLNLLFLEDHLTRQGEKAVGWLRGD